MPTTCKKTLIIPALVATLALMGAPSVWANAFDTMMAEYKAAGAGPFDAARGKQMWTEVHVDAETGQERQCASCHTTDLTATGKHKKTGKAIKPLAPSANPDRLTDVKEIKKWFKRNCEWTVGRECTAQEQGDFLTYIKGQ